MISVVNFLSAMQSNSIPLGEMTTHSSSLLTLNVLIMEGMALVAVAERHLSSSTLLCWFVAAEPSTYCKYCMYSLFIFAVYLYGE